MTGGGFFSMVSLFQRAYPPAVPASGLAFWFPFQGYELIAQGGEQGSTPIQTDNAGIAAIQPQNILYVGTINGIPCMTCEVSPAQPLPPAWKAISLRAIFAQFDEEAYNAAGYASQILNWQRTSKFCPVCGSPNGPLSESWGRHCPVCGHQGFPQAIPAVLALVHNGDYILLATGRGGKNYSILAGFVEPGETLEDCVRREVAEESGVVVDNVTYISSQPWPFPTQLMVGFHARYVTGELRPEPAELDDAGWFHVDNLPALPPTLSLSYQLIRDWANALRPDNPPLS